MKKKGGGSVRWFPEVKKAENFSDDARLFRTEMSNYET